MSDNNNNNNIDSTIDPQTGRCTLHPGIQLLNKKSNGEWRTLLKACPLCVSGLPPTVAASAIVASSATTTNRTYNNYTIPPQKDHDDQQRGEQHHETSMQKDDDSDDDGSDDDLDQKILLKKQQSTHKHKKKKHKKKKKSGHHHHDHGDNDGHNDSSGQDQVLLSPRSRPRSPSPQSPYKPRHSNNNLMLSTMAVNGADNDVNNNNNDHDHDGSGGRRELFKDAPPPPLPLYNTARSSSSSRQQQQQQQQQHLRSSSMVDTDSEADEDSVDRSNRNTFRQYIQMDKERQVGKRMSSSEQQLHGGEDEEDEDEEGGSPRNYVRKGSGGSPQYSAVEEKQRSTSRRRQSDEASAASHYSSTERSASRGRSHQTEPSQSEIRSTSRHRRQSDASVDSSHYSSAQGSHYSSAHSRRQSEASDGSSYYSSVVNSDEDEDGSDATYLEDSPTDQDPEVYLDDDDAQSPQTPDMATRRTNVSGVPYPPPPLPLEPNHHSKTTQSQSYAQDVDQYELRQQNQNLYSTSYGYQQQQQQQQRQPFYSPLSAQDKRPDPEDYQEYHANLSATSSSAAERMVRHHQMSGSQSQQQSNPYPQSANYAQYVTQEQNEYNSAQHFSPSNNKNDEDDYYQDDDDDEREVLEPEEVSMISMNSSASRNLKRAKQLQQLKQELKLDPDGDDEDDEPIKTCEYDDKGRCVRHPNVKLRKKKMLKGWVTLLSNCPECCLEEMRRVKKKYNEQVSSSGGGGSSIHSNSVSSSVRKKKKKKKKKKSHPPPIAQLNVASKGSSMGSGVDDNSTGTASTFTHTSSFTNTSGKWQNYLSSNNSATSAPPTTARVTRLPYNDQFGENAWYTGEVDAMRGIPNGWGVMNYPNGHVHEGEWRNGVSVIPAKTREAPNVFGGDGGGGFYGNHSPPHHHEQRRGGSVPPMGRSPSLRGGSQPPISRRQMTQLEPLREDRSSYQGQNNLDPRTRVVSGMPYRDNRGFVIGAYTGEVDEYHVPNGIGSMRYSSGLVSEGRWIDGELDDGYNVTDDEGDNEEAIFMSSSRSVGPGTSDGRGYNHQTHPRQGNHMSAYPGQNMESKLSGLEQKLQRLDFNRSEDDFQNNGARSVH